MSLVEYGSSDDELDENNLMPDVKPSSEKEEIHSKHSLSSLFASLPTPKYSSATNSNVVEETEVKEVNSSCELPIGCEKKQKQPVKILIPNLNEFDEDDIPRKRQKSQVSSGLMDILPAPKNTTLGKTAAKLVPHVLTKKPAKTSSVLEAKKPTQPAPNNNKNFATSLVEYDDKDSDDEGNEASGSDFFSLNSNEQHTSNNSEVYNISSNYVTSEIASYNNVNTSDKSLDNGQNSSNTTAADATNAGTPFVSTGNGYNNNLSNFGQDQVFDVNTSSLKPQVICEEYNVVHPSQQHVNFLMKPEPQEIVGPVEVTDEIDITDERFLRLQGKKERGKKEDIQIIDISADQQLPGVGTTLVKNLTEELAYKPSRKKGEMPTSQQRRKHQITYLAFQAKERELELKNQWSTNRMTRRQTQAKYGF